MNKQQIMQEAIRKAIDNGWTRAYRFDVRNDGYLIELWESGQPGAFIYTPEQIIFDHDFAKAMWGKGKTWTDKNGEVVTIQNPNLWKAKLRSMVCSKDRIKYLGEHL